MAKTQMDWLNFSQIIADTPAKIRRCDVYRFLEEAEDTYDGVEEGAAWLRTVRPDLAEEIAECLTDLSRSTL